MDSTTTGALRVVLNVTEVSAVTEMERMRANTERMMKAYHFQQTMRAYGRAVLTKVNANWDVGLMTRDEYHQMEDMEEGDYDGPQYLVNILVLPDDYADSEDDHDVMAFVEPTLHTEDSYLIANGSKYGNYADTIPLADLETLANFLGDYPEVYDAFMGQMTAYKELDLDDMDINTPSNAIVVV
jgi:hypothetical protein